MKAIFIKNPFKRLQKGAVAALCIISAVMLILAGSYSCKNDPAEAILGKWELIEQGTFENEMRIVEPNGEYTEYLSGGIFLTFIPFEDRSYYSIYRIDKKYIYHYHKNIAVCMCYRYEITKDGHLKMTFERGDNIPIHMYPSMMYNKIELYQPKN